jgi:hypothetical protein
MPIWTVALLWAFLMAARVAFLALNFRDLGGLWHDYARRGLRYQLARGLDAITLVIFGVAAVLSLRGLNAETPDRLAKVFVAWLGFLLLERLSAHRFPQTNAPGAMRDAQAALAANALLSVLGAGAATGIAALFFWWRG